MSPSELERAELEAQLEASARKAFAAIEESRAKMSPEQLEEADRKADAIVEDALRNVKSSRLRA
jgi:hypothetical protein